MNKIVDLSVDQIAMINNRFYIKETKQEIGTILNFQAKIINNIETLILIQDNIEYRIRR